MHRQPTTVRAGKRYVKPLCAHTETQGGHFLWVLWLWILGSADVCCTPNSHSNPGVKTIEGDIFDAFCRAGAVSEENAVNPNKIQLQRAARTDRGVHAAGNLLTAKLMLEPPVLAEGQTLTEYVNTLLPPHVRIWGMRRVQNAFNARTSCDSRLYEYLLPTYVFLPPKPYSSMWKMLRRLNVGEESSESSVAPWDDPAVRDNAMLNHPFWQGQGYEKEFAEDMHAKRKWRISADELARVRSVFDMYTGPHNFHNFTVGKEFRDRSSHRVMKKLSVSDPKIINDTEWVSVKFHGQSFMLHQIRKMIGLLVLIGRTNAPLSLISQAFGPARIHVPKAPGLGLLLVEPHFGGYNIKVANNNERIDRMIAQRAGTSKPLPENPENGKREPVDFVEFQEKMDAFKQTYIYDEIHRTEDATAEFAKWLNYLDVFVGPDLYVTCAILTPASTSTQRATSLTVPFCAWASNAARRAGSPRPMARSSRIRSRMSRLRTRS